MNKIVLISTYRIYDRLEDSLILKDLMSICIENFSKSIKRLLGFLYHRKNIYLHLKGL